MKLIKVNVGVSELLQDSTAVCINLAAHDSFGHTLLRIRLRILEARYFQRIIAVRSHLRNPLASQEKPFSRAGFCSAALQSHSVSRAQTTNLICLRQVTFDLRSQFAIVL